MATIPPINYGALKVTFPANLPRNEKDLICMLLAGRLKDLWKGKLICAELAIDDLVKDLTGVSPLNELRNQLTKLKSGLNDLKRASGYDQILSQVNKSLGQIGNVFSLGGLCPSPITPPQIPDVLGQLNQNLFGQANNILNSLVNASNPKVCLGNGPTGFGLDWSKVNGDLRSLKNSIEQFKRDPAGMERTMKAFESNIKSQRNRLNSELKRLQKNLSDPFGINEKRNTVAAIQRTKATSDGYPVKDRNGITYPNPAKSMIPGEVDAVLARTDPAFTNPTKYVTKPVYDYCGTLTGYTRELVTGDPGYLGYDTVFGGLNVATPTTNPTATYAQYDYLFKEENSAIKIYNKSGEVVSDINLERGRHYRIGVQIVGTTNLAIYDVDDAMWANGITATQEPEYGKGFEIVTLENPCSSLTVELDWAVNIENPTTPNLLIWKANNGQQGNIIIGGPTSIPAADKTYDVDNAVRKALTFSKSQQYTDSSGLVVKEEVDDSSRVYSMTSQATGLVNFNVQTNMFFANGISVIDDIETLDEDGVAVEGNKILKFVQPYGSKFIVSKLYYSESAGFDIMQYAAFITDSLTNEIQGYQPLANLKFTKPIEFLNDTKLPNPAPIPNKYMLTLPGNIKLENEEEMSVELVDASTLKVHLSENRIAPSYAGEFLIAFEIGIDSNDPDRLYQTTNPFLKKIQTNFKGNNFDFGQTLVLNA